ncbi:MAG: PIG-L family deacetylase [Acidobacteriota bacterium]|jgi:LmbE family N-acetylglucosaminyl deacetylase
MPDHVLTIFAHPDDAETMAGGSLLHLASTGARLTLCIVTDGDKGTNDETDSAAAVIARRRREQARAAARLGAEVVYLGFEDGLVQPTLELRKALVRVIRQLRPDIILTHDPTVWFRHNVYINHPDHRAVGQAVLEAVYPAVKKPRTFPDLFERENLAPHVVGEIWVGPTDHPNHWVDISRHLEEKIALICEHASQFPPEPTRAAFTRLAREAGAPAGLAAAESFRRLYQVRQTVRALANPDTPGAGPTGQ